MMVDLNEKELFSLMVLVHMDFLNKRNKNADVTFEERLEVKLAGSLLKETGYVSQFVNIDAAFRLIEGHRIKEESLSPSKDRQPGQH